MLIVDKGYAEDNIIDVSTYPVLAAPSHSYAQPILEINTSSDIVVTTSTSVTQLTGVQSINLVVANGVALTQATDPTDIQTGQYYFNPSTQQITVNTTAASVTINAQSSKGVPYFPSLLSSGYPDLFEALPLEGTITFSGRWGEHPTAQCKFSTSMSKNYLEQFLAPGLQMVFFGAQMMLTNPQFEEYPQGAFPNGKTGVTLSLTGAWQFGLSQSVFVRSDGSNSIPSGSAVDPECPLVQADSNQTVSVAVLCAKAGVPLSGLGLKPVSISGAAKSTTLTPASVLTEDRAFVAGGFIRYSDSVGVQVIPVGGGQSWTYQENQIRSGIQTTYQAIAKPFYNNFTTIPSTLNPKSYADTATKAAFVYANVKVVLQATNTNGSPTLPATQNSSIPRYVQQPPTPRTVVTGDKNADQPLVGVTEIKNLTMIFDLGGQTSNRTTKYYLGQTLVTSVDETWGFMATASQLVGGGNTISGSPSEFWQQVKYVRTDYQYDTNTGYALGNTVTGFEYVRAKTENPSSPETLSLASSDPTLPLYQFFQNPIYGVKQSYLALSPNNDYSQAIQYTKVCSPNGQSSVVPSINPNFVPNYYVAQEITESLSFTRFLNPSNSGATGSQVLLPDYMVGSENLVYKEVDFTDATYQQIYSNAGETNGAQLSPPNFTTYNKTYTASGEQLGNVKTQINDSYSDGYPPVAEKQPAQYVQQQPQTSTAQTDTPTQANVTYLICSDGYGPADPIGGTDSFSVAQTLTDLTTGARTKYQVRNLRDGYKEQLTIDCNPNIREGDRFNYYWRGFIRERIVIAFNNEIKVEGTPYGRVRLSGKTTLTLGKLLTPSLSITQLSSQQIQNNRQVPTEVAVFINEAALGQPIDWSAIVSRRNY